MRNVKSDLSSVRATLDQLIEEIVDLVRGCEPSIEVVDDIIQNEDGKMGLEQALKLIGAYTILCQATEKTLFILEEDSVI